MAKWIIAPSGRLIVDMKTVGTASLEEDNLQNGGSTVRFTHTDTQLDTVLRIKDPAMAREWWKSVVAGLTGLELDLPEPDESQ